MLNNLREDDLFNIVVYDDRVESFKPELERYGSRTREEAERYVDNIREGGSTNIDSALKTALGMIRDDSRPSYILFLTDGLPTAGETQELRIADNCRQANSRRARLFCFGVGYDVNARLLDRLSGGNSGTSEYVKPDEDLEAHVGRFYSKLTSPVLVDLRIELTGTDVNRTYPRDLPDLFDGGQIVWVGRYRQSGRTTLRISGKVGGERRSFEFPAELADSDRGSGHEFVERIWATRRVGYLIDQVDMSGQNKELIDELVSLSTRYGILTPYTSFLADERVPLHAAMQNANRARESFRELGAVSGSYGVAQRDLKQYYMRTDKAAMGGAGGFGGGLAAQGRIRRHDGPAGDGTDSGWERHFSGRCPGRSGDWAGGGGSRPRPGGQTGPGGADRGLPDGTPPRKCGPRFARWDRRPSTSRTTAGSIRPSSRMRMPRPGGSASSATSSSASRGRSRPSSTST